MLSACAAAGCGQRPTTSHEVDATLDHHRIVVGGTLHGPRGMRRVRVWVDPGNPELWLTRELSAWLDPHGGAADARASAPATIPSGASLAVGEARFPLDSVGPAVTTGRTVLAPGLAADINLPASLLRDRVLRVDYARHRLRVASSDAYGDTSGVPMRVDPKTALLSINMQTDAGTLRMGVDPGASTTFLVDSAFARLTRPGVRVGAFGDANLWGGNEETSWRVGFAGPWSIGGHALSAGTVVALERDLAVAIESRAGIPIAGLLGANMLLARRLTLNYRSGRLLVEGAGTPPCLRAIGVTLRPTGADGFRIVGVTAAGARFADSLHVGDVLTHVDGESVRGATMGRVWERLIGDSSKSLTVLRQAATRNIRAEPQQVGCSVGLNRPRWPGADF